MIVAFIKCPGNLLSLFICENCEEYLLNIYIIICSKENRYLIINDVHSFFFLLKSNRSKFIFIKNNFDIKKNNFI